MNISIGLSRDNTWISKTIRWFGKRQSGSANYSHAFLKIDDIVIEETFAGLRIKPYSKYNKIIHKLYTPKFLNEEEETTIRNTAMAQVGTIKGIYGYAKLPLFALDALTKSYWFTSHLSIKHFKVCSQWCCYLFYKYANYDKFSTWRSYSPDGIDDELRGHKMWYATPELGNK
jgi:hypothetical protein